MRFDLLTENYVTGITGPLLFLERNVFVGVNEAVEVVGAPGQGRLGRIMALDEDRIVVGLLEQSARLGGEGVRVRVRFRGEPVMMWLGPGLLGRVFDGVGRPRAGGPPVIALARRRFKAMTINPAERGQPQDFTETGVSTIDILNTLVRGQKLPIFSAGGLPHDRLAASIAQNARLRGCEGGGTRALPWPSPVSASAMTAPRRSGRRCSDPARWNTRRCSSTSPRSSRPSVCYPGVSP
ncbi:MAG: hypothetical protein GY717_00435 [Rhodobacteraceae bacterium]|nr:hypothetical protein [Paracoccaceae bacterium]